MHNRYLISNAVGRRRFADELIDYLIRMGVEYLFGMPAESVNSLVHAASLRSEIQVVTTRHETAAALMAVGYARSSGRLGVCFGTAGPGATNLLAGAWEAFVGRVPLLAISGQVPVASMGRDSFQEIDSEALFKPCTASSVHIHAASQFERFARSCVLATHESTACHVAIPGDVLYSPIGAGQPGLFIPPVPVPGLPSKEELSAVADFLESDDLAVVISCADSAYADLVQQLSAHLNCPVYNVGDSGVIPADDVLVVGRCSPLIKQRVYGHANLLELTDRRFDSRSMPYIRRVICDVEATLQTILDTAPQERAGGERPRVYSDLGGVDVLAAELGLDVQDVVSSLAGIPGAALALGIGGALAAPSGSRSVVLTEFGHLSQFVADLSTLVSVNGNVVVICLVPDRETLSGISHLGAAMSMHSDVAEHPEDLPRVLADVRPAGGPAIVAVLRGAGDAASPTFRPGEQSLANELAANVESPVQLSDFCAAPLPCFRAAQRSAHAQAPSMSAAALRKMGSPSAATVAASASALLLQLNGIYDAALDSARILVATVETERWSLDSGRVLDEVSAARYVIDDATTAAATVRQACTAAAAPGSGVVHLQVLPAALDTEWAPDRMPARDRAAPHPPVAIPDESALFQAVSALREADRVAIVAGRGAAGCSDLLAELSRLLGCSVHLTMGGDSVLDDPGLRAHGRIGGSGDLRAFHRVAQADVLLLIGVSNRGSAFDLAASGRTIVVNLDPQAMLQLAQRDICVLGDAAAALEAIVGALRAGAAAGPPPRSALQRNRLRIAQRRAERAPLRASSLTRAINEELGRFDGISTVCADVGVNTLWVYRYITSMSRSIWSASFGTMGFAVPAAITVARNSAESKLAIAVAGDGGTSVTLSQIRSAAGAPTPVVFVVVNNLALAAIKFESEIMGWPDRGSAIPDINFARYAASVGVASRRVDTLRDFRAAFQEAISAPGPYLIDARCILNDAPIQAGKVNWRQVVGFFIAWSREGRPAAGTFREVVRAVVRGKLYEKGLSD